MYISHIYSANFTSKCGAIALLVSPFKNKELGEPERDGLLDSSLIFQSYTDQTSLLLFMQ